MTQELDDENEGLNVTAALAAGGDLIRHFEENFDVNSLRFRGIKAWPRIRSMLVFAYTNGFFHGDKTPIKRYGTLSTINRLTNIPRDVEAAADKNATDFRKAAKIYRARPLAFIGRQPRQTNVDGKMWNWLFDPLGKLLPPETPDLVNLSLQPAQTLPAKTDTMFADLDPIMNWLTRLEAVHDLFIRPPINPRSLDGIEKFVAELPPQLAEHISVSAIVKDLAFIERMAIVFRLYLEEAKPPVVFLSGHQRVNMAMILAARQLGIKTVDIQHGASAFSPTSYKWHSWHQIPEEGYELLPNFFWVWGQQAADNINRFANPKCRLHKTLVGGHPALLNPVEYKLPYAFKADLDEADMRILVALGHLDLQGLPNNLLEAIKRSPAGWKWMLRLHPNDMKSEDSQNRIRELLVQHEIENVEFIVSSQAPLTTLLSEADWHVTAYSSSAFEASAFGVPTLYVHPLSQSLHGYLLEKPGFFFELEAEGILSILQKRQHAESLVQNDPEVAREILDELVHPAEKGVI